MECAGRAGAATALSGGRGRDGLRKISVRAKAVSRCACHRSPRHAGALVERNSQTERRQARHSCSLQNQTRFQAPSGAEYAAPTGLGNWVARVATKISLLTELRTGASSRWLGCSLYCLISISVRNRRVFTFPKAISSNRREVSTS